MLETLMFFVFCLAIFGLIGYNVIADDADEFWPQKPGKGKFIPTKKARNDEEQALPQTASEIRKYLLKKQKTDDGDTGNSV